MTTPGIEPVDLAWSGAMVRTWLKRKALRLAAHERDDHSLCRPETCETAAAREDGGGP